MGGVEGTFDIGIGLKLSFNSKTALSAGSFSWLRGVVGGCGGVDSTLGIEISLRLKFNTRATLIRFFVGCAGLLGVSWLCEGLNLAYFIEIILAIFY